MTLESSSSIRRGHTPIVRTRAGSRCALALASAVIVGGCTSTLDAGYGLLPIDQRNPVILLNDGAYDNWSGEYAVLMANGGGAPLAAIIVDEDSDWPDIQTNLGGYQDLITAARSSGLQNLPDPISSVGAPLVRPASSNIADTQANRSAGALLIVDLSKSLGLPNRPLVIATGGALTDVADAYLVDPTVTERVVVVSSLGSATSSGGGMGSPNGNNDPWADFIVASQFRYIQVSAWYDQLTDVPTSRLSELPNNALGAWIAAKQPNLWQWSPASDQVSVLAAGLPAFATAIDRVSATRSADGGATTADGGATTADGGATVGPNLAMEQGGPNWLVTACDGKPATALFWKVLLGTH
jgi:hypothetical protein